MDISVEMRELLKKTMGVKWDEVREGDKIIFVNELLEPGDWDRHVYEVRVSKNGVYYYLWGGFRMDFTPEQSASRLIKVRTEQRHSDALTINPELSRLYGGNGD